MTLIPTKLIHFVPRPFTKIIQGSFKGVPKFQPQIIFVSATIIGKKQPTF